ncbi:MFS transporter [bacterium RCC_150]
MSTTYGRPAARPMEVRAVVSGALGSAFEFFDFAVYGALSATIFPSLFFKDLGSTAALLASFATFGVGFLARPLGSLVFGHLGDRLGRKPILFTTLILMGVSSVLIGCLPTGQGAAIATLLVSLRFLQGFSLGGEMVGNQLMTMEHGDKSRRGLLGSLVMMGSPISQVLANLSLVALSTTLSAGNFTSWGWRVPFLAGSLIVVIAVVTRLKLEETPAYIASKEMVVTSPAGKSRGMGLRVFVTHPLTVVRLVLLWGGPTLCFYLVAVYGLNYLTKSVGMSSDVSFLILAVANGASALACVAGGLLCDRIGRKTVMLCGIGGVFVGIALFFTLAGSNVLATGLIVTLVLCSIQLASGVQPALFAEQFPTEVRFAGTAMSHSLANLIFAAPSAFLAAALVALGGNTLIMFVALALLAVSAMVLPKLKEGGHLNLEEFAEEGTPQTTKELRV